MDDHESIGQAVPVHVPASTFHRGFCTILCYFSIFPLIFHVFILAVGNFSSESADSDVLLGHWLGTTQQFCVGLQKMFSLLISNPKNIPVFSAYPHAQH